MYCTAELYPTSSSTSFSPLDKESLFDVKPSDVIDAYPLIRHTFDSSEMGDLLLFYLFCLTYVRFSELAPHHLTADLFESEL